MADKNNSMPPEITPESLMQQNTVIAVDEATADSKGRITVGAEHANETIRYAILQQPAQPRPPDRCDVCGGSVGNTWMETASGKAGHPDCIEQRDSTTETQQ
jgi:hypothetical protein